MNSYLEIHFLELPKFRNKKNKDYRENDIARWLAFLEKDISETTLKKLISLDAAIEKAEQRIEYLSSDDEAMRIYYERERSFHERANMISSAEERKSIENAINFLKLGVDIDTVTKGTGLTKEKVVELYNKL
ncbi:PD-(D/E)XK nuclease family transposase [Clostridium uliginosum]|uniref:PD-(D/E)XK nuclease family transposase n=1 Tax=Clostridium uliginosum TaxID=119641 RepID=A0A1I1RX32_9CLOT|nr:PD-(D/E)XK nuclease family transposase [Clostridium uliginosum]SFD38815.1 conserved hypothetical protein (putative transposase or invertase) [Clostridium uliginosum]